MGVVDREVIIESNELISFDLVSLDDKHLKEVLLHLGFWEFTHLEWLKSFRIEALH